MILANGPSFLRMMTMASRKFPRVAMPLLMAGIFLTSMASARAQDPQSESVADAARRAREEKKSSPKTSTKSSKVITDDDVVKTPKPSDGINVGAPAKLETQPPSDASVAAVEKADQTAASGGVKKDDDPEIAQAKEQVAKVSKELDLAKRELALDQDTFYSNTDYAHDKAGQTKLADEQQQINVKQQELDGLKAHLQDLEARKKTAGETPAPAKPQ
jgi:hypothetical protein